MHPMSADLPALFEQIFSASPWPMLMIAEDGSVIAASDEAGAQSRGASLRDRAAQYLALLQGNVAWLTPQTVNSTRSLPAGAQVHERIHLQRTRWGSSLTIVDETELHQLRDAQAQTARLAALGFMVAGVCHEVTNPLTSLHSIVQILRAERQPNPELLTKGLDNIAVNVKRILDISRRLVTFSRVGDEPRTRFAIDEAIEEALHVLRQDNLLRDIELDHRIDTTAMVSGNFGQVREIFLNLFVNAVQSMSGKGRLRIATRAETHRVEVLVTDSGPGIPAHATGRIFEPFFTTKGGAQGTGLGLAISNEIAHEHGGTIDLRRNSIEGATFCVTLPRAIS
jgi:two-component system NtrC family sensor kinase